MHLLCQMIEYWKTTLTVEHVVNFKLSITVSCSFLRSEKEKECLADFSIFIFHDI